jgi:hypothetical protein
MTMRSEAYAAILYALAEGIHPVTGDLLPEGLIDRPDVIRALYAGARMLESSARAAMPGTGTQEPGTRVPDAETPEPAAGISEAANPQPGAESREPDAVKPKSGKSGDRPAPKPGRENAGKSWSKEDDALLMESYAAGTSVYHMAKAFKRSAFAIEARIEKLETSQPGAQKHAYRIIRSSGAMDAAPGGPAAPGTH